MQRFRLTVFLLLLACSFAAQAQHADSAAPVAGTTPVEAKQFDFLVGQWEVEVRPKVSSLVAMIHGAPRLAGTWKAWRAFDGLGIEDELRIVDGSGNPISLTHALRIYAKTEGRWNVSGLDVYRARFSAASGQWQDGEMHLDGHGNDVEGKPALTRTRYYAISADGFRMQQDRSTDNGQSWDEGVLTIEAKRAAAH